jgi:glycosyltransferase involved in cell wall biosynthesis
LSVIIIAKDEADRIGAAIESVGFAQEVVVFDSGSTDDTVGVARSMGATVIETDWPGFVAQKNRAMAAASHDWVLSIDADERVSPALAEAIVEALSGAPACRGYRVDRLGFWEGHPIRHGTWWPARQVRLCQRVHARFEGRDPHDRLVVDGAVGRLNGELLHFPYRSLAEHLSTIYRYTELFVVGCLREGRRARWWDLLVRPPAHLVKALLLRRGLLDGVPGLCIACLGAAHVMLKWGQLYLAQRDGAQGSAVDQI